MARLCTMLLILFGHAALAQDVTVAFSPGTTAAVIGLVDSAGKTIRLAAYSFTSKPIVEALIRAHKRGVDVEAVLDRSNATARYSSATFLANSGIPTRIDYRYAIMHDKFMVVDGVSVETGSFNYTRAAEEKNAENVVILRDNREVASKYSTEWQKLWNESESYQRRN